MSTLREQLDQVRSVFGRLTPTAVVDAARPDDAPLHSRFEWDDTVAAEKWRREQASELIRSYRITYKETTNGPVTVRGFQAVRGLESPHSSEYVPTEEALADPFTRQLVLRECERDVAALKSKYAHLKEFAAILTAAAA